MKEGKWDGGMVGGVGGVWGGVEGSMGKEGEESEGGCGIGLIVGVGGLFGMGMGGGIVKRGGGRKWGEWGEDKVEGRKRVVM